MGAKGSGRQPSPCGTQAKYQWHRKRGEDCQLCRDAHAAHYRARTGSQKRALRLETAKQRKQRHNDLMLKIKLEKGRCHDCWIKCTVDNWFIFDWDHRVPADKAFTISQRKHDVSTDRLLAEIAKCDLVCANCHRHRTFGQLKRGDILPYKHMPTTVPTLFDLL
jgi:hypothetical protein